LRGRRILEKPKRGNAQRCGWGGGVEAVADQQARGDEAGARVFEDGVYGFGEGRVEDDSGELGVGGCEFEGEVGAETAAAKNNCAGIDVTGCREVGEGRFGVLAHAGFAGVGEEALAIAAIVEGEYIEAGVVEVGESVERVAEIAVCAVEVKGGVPG